MSCEEVMDLIQRSLDDDLQEGEQALLNHHIRECPLCLETYHKLEALSQDLAQLPRVELPYSIVDRILPLLEQEGDNKADGKYAGFVASVADGHRDETGKTKPRQALEFSTTKLKQKRYWLSSLVVAAGLFIVLAITNQPANEQPLSLFSQDSMESAEFDAATQMTPEVYISIDDASDLSEDGFSISSGGGVDSYAGNGSELALSVPDDVNRNMQVDDTPSIGTVDGTKSDESQTTSISKSTPEDSIHPSGDISESDEVKLAQYQGVGGEDGIGMLFTHQEQTVESPDGKYIAHVSDQKGLKGDIRIKRDGLPYYLTRHQWEEPWEVFVVRWITNDLLYYVLYHPEDNQFEYWSIDLEERSELQHDHPLDNGKDNG